MCEVSWIVHRMFTTGGRLYGNETAGLRRPAGHAYVHQNQVRAVRAPAAEDFLAVGRGGHALDAGHGRDRAAERLSGKRGVVADENGCHA